MNTYKIATLLFALALVGGGSACGGSSDGDGTGGSGGDGGNGGIQGTGGSGGTPGTGGDGGGSAGTGGDGGGSAGTGGDGGGSAGTGGVGGDGGGSAGTGGVGGGSAGTGGDGGGIPGTGGTGGDGGWPGTGGTGGGMGGSGGGGAPSASDCTDVCNGYWSCGWIDPWEVADCSAECQALGTVDEVACVLSAVPTCDFRAVDRCFPDEASAWCEEVCAEVGACSDNPAESEMLCFDECYTYDWYWDSDLAPCVEAAAPTCNMASLNACFSWDDPACTAACNHVYLGCGISISDPDWGGEMSRSLCSLLCEWDEWPPSQLQCLTNAACTTAAVDACMP